MSIKWLMFFLMTWAILVLFGIGVEETFAKVTGAGDMVGTVNTLLAFHLLKDVSVGGVTVFWVPDISWFSALGKVLTFQFTFMTNGPIGWLGYWLFFIPLTISMIVATLFAVRGSPST